MDTVFDFCLGEFGMEFLTLCHMEVVCGPWTSFNGIVVSDFDDIIYPFSTIEYEYKAFQNQKYDFSTDSGVVSNSESTPNGLQYSRCCKWMKHFNRSILWKYACQGSSRYTKRRI